MRILVTGGAGFIGSHLVERLMELGHDIVCLDDFNDFYDPALKRANLARVLGNPRFRLVEGDVRDIASLQQCFGPGGIQTVVHLAARAGVRPSIREPGLYYDVNVMGTLMLLEAMRDAGVKRLVFASSSSVYGNNSKVPFSETDPVDTPISPYAASKKAGELLCHTYHHLHGFDVFCLRFFTAYGPRQRPDMAIHQFVGKILSGEVVTVYGDGSSRRDYTYIDDIVQGLEGAINTVRGFEVINLGESRTTTLADLVAAIERALRLKANIRSEAMQPGDVAITCADISKAKNLLGYEPRFDLNEGIEKFCRWFTKGCAAR